MLTKQWREKTKHQLDEQLIFATKRLIHISNVVLFVFALKIQKTRALHEMNTLIANWFERIMSEIYLVIHR